MARKDKIDGFGAASLIGFSALLAFNQVVIKVVNDGLQPVFAAGLRSVFAVIILVLAMRLMGRALTFEPGTRRAGLLLGAIFSAEFVFLFLALDLTTVARASVIFYSMPLWMALGAHLLLPGERITGMKAAGLALAFCGVAWAILDRPDTGTQASLSGDILALCAAFCWAGIGLTVRGTSLNRVSPYMQHFYQLGVSALVLMALSPLFGPFIRELEPIHLAGLGFQIVAVASLGFLFWLWIIGIYPAAAVASFSFLAPVFGVLMGWALLGETVGPQIFGALALVALGLVLINRPARVP